MSASRGLEHLGEEISFGPKINAAPVRRIVSVEYGKPIVVHSGWHKVTSTTGHYCVDNGICIKLLPELRDEVIIYKVLSIDELNTTNSGTA
jgi:hypothetical protein